MLMKKRPICGHEKAKYIYFMRKFNTYKSIVMTICMNLYHEKGRKINNLLFWIHSTNQIFLDFNAKAYPNDFT